MSRMVPTSGRRRPSPSAAFYKVERPAQASLRCVRVLDRKLGVSWHYHPEYQLTLLLAGNGQRMVGDSIEPAAAGDLTLLGPNLPHFFDIDLPRGHGPAGRRHRPVDAVIVQFDAEGFGPAFWKLPETLAARELLEAAGRGIVFSDRMRGRVQREIVGLLRLGPLPRLLRLVDLLHTLAGDREARPVCSSAYVTIREDVDSDRMALVIRRIQEHVRDAAAPPTRTELAELAGISVRTFSRVFRGRMGRTLPQFINELRVGRARRLLVETNLAITEVARRCGFRNLSNFNTQFRSLVGQTPHAFRGACRSALAE